MALAAHLAPMHLLASNGEVIRMRTISRSPIDWLWRVFLAGFLAAIVFVGVIATYQTFETSRECKGGAFGHGFGTGFDRPRCDVGVRIAGGPEMTFRSPW